MLPLPPRDGEHPGKATTYIGTAAAALCAIAGGFNLYNKHKDTLIGGPRHNMPRRIQRQILAGSSEEDDDDYSPMLVMSSSGRNSWRNAMSSSVITAGGYISTSRLSAIQEEYKKELHESNGQGEWEVRHKVAHFFPCCAFKHHVCVCFNISSKCIFSPTSSLMLLTTTSLSLFLHPSQRATNIAQTLGMIQQVLDMRDEVSYASQVGDTQTISATSSKLSKMQMALEERLNDEYGTSYEEPSNEGCTMELESANSDTCNMMESTNHGDSGNDNLSKEEIIALQTQLEEKMKSIDTRYREGMSEWRSCRKRIEVLNKTL